MVVGKDMVCKKMVDKNMPVEMVLRIVPHSDVRSVATWGRVSKYYYEVLVEDLKGLWSREPSLGYEIRFLRFIDGCRKLADLKSSMNVLEQTTRGSVKRKFAQLTFSDYERLGEFRDGSLKWRIEDAQRRKDYIGFKIERTILRCILCCVPQNVRRSCFEMMPVDNILGYFFAFILIAFYFLIPLYALRFGGSVE